MEIATVYLFFPETHNRTLEELSFMFEGKAVQEKVEHSVEKQLEAEGMPVRMPIGEENETEVSVTRA